MWSKRHDLPQKCHGTSLSLPTSLPQPLFALLLGCLGTPNSMGPAVTHAGMSLVRRKSSLALAHTGTLRGCLHPGANSIQLSLSSLCSLSTRLAKSYRAP
jgi:hypothetical protein